MQPTIERFDNHDGPLVPDDYFVVSARSDWWYVSTTMARFVEARLDEVPPPRWITFVDVTGAGVRVLTRLVESICQCTAEQRATARAFFRARKREQQCDRDWNQDE